MVSRKPVIISSSLSTKETVHQRQRLGCAYKSEAEEAARLIIMPQVINKVDFFKLLVCNCACLLNLTLFKFNNF
jgi:hypothetical protein